MLQRLDLLTADLLARVNPMPAEYQGPRLPLTEEAGRAVHLLVKALDLQARVAGFSILPPVHPTDRAGFHVTVLQFAGPVPLALPGQSMRTVEYQAEHSDQATPEQPGVHSQGDEIPVPVTGAPLTRSPCLSAESPA